MDPSEISVVVYRAKGLQSKRKSKHKFNVTFGIGNNKAKSDNVDDPAGNPEWNTEAQLNIEDPLEPLILKVKDKDDILGQITLHMHELPTAKPSRPKAIPLQPHKKCPNPHGDVVFEAWISNYSDNVPANNAKSKHKEKTLANQMAQFKGAGGSSESIGSTVSGFSTMSEATTKKKSALKKLKGAFKHSPKLGRSSKMQGKASAQSCIDLTYGQPNLSLQNIDFNGSSESLASQTSELSKKSGGEKKSKNPFKMLKMGKSPLTGRKELKLSKNNSSSMHDLAFGGQGLTIPRTGSSESMDKLSNKSHMDASFPGKFDLTAPTALIATLAEEEKVEKIRKEEEKEEREKQIRKKEDSVSIHSGDGVSPKVSQRRRLSVQTRSLRDDPRLKKTASSSSPLFTRHVDAIAPTGSRDNVRGVTLGSSSENLSVSPSEGHGFKDPRHSDGDNRSIRSSSSHENEPYATPFYMSTPPAKKKLTAERSLPEITGISPSQGSMIGGTKVTIRGTNLGLDKADVVCMNICGANCLGKLAYISDRKLQVTTKPWKPGSGKIIVETQSGGRAHSLVEFTFLDDAKPPPSPVMHHDRVSVSPPSPVPLHNPVSPHSPASPQRAVSPPAINVLDTFEAPSQTPPSKPRRSSNGSPRTEATHNVSTEDASTLESVRKTPPPKPMRVVKPNESTPPEKKRMAPQPSPTTNRIVQHTEILAHSPVTKKKEVVVEKIPQVTARDAPVPRRTPEFERREKPVSHEMPECDERQEPEGMTMVKEHKSPEVKHVEVFNSEKLGVVKDTMRHTSDSSETAPSRDELLDVIRQLQAEKTELQQENSSMKGYMEKIIDKVIDRCPDVLCIDPNAGGERSPLKLT